MSRKIINSLLDTIGEILWFQYPLFLLYILQPIRKEDKIKRCQISKWISTKSLPKEARYPFFYTCSECSVEV